MLALVKCLYKKLLKLNKIKKWPNNLKRQFTQEDIQMESKHMVRCPISLVIRKSQVETMMKCHYTSDFRMAKIRKNSQVSGTTLAGEWQECTGPCDVGVVRTGGPKISGSQSPSYSMAFSESGPWSLTFLSGPTQLHFWDAHFLLLDVP